VAQRVGGEVVKGPSETQNGRIGLLFFLRVSRLVDAALAIDFRVSDEPGALTLAAISAPSILELLTNAEVFLKEAQDYYDSKQVTEGLSEPGSLDDIGAMISSEMAARDIRDLSFIATGQIRSCAERLEGAIGRQNILNMVSCSDDALCRLRRGLIPIEAAIGEFEGIPPPGREWVDIDISLQTRRLYGQLRRELLAVGEPDDEELRPRLSEFSVRLAEMKASPVYTSLRINDRVQVRGLYERIARWLKQGKERSPVEARSIWQDLSTFVGLLAEINNRQELHEHDRRVIQVAYHSLYANVRPPKVIPGEILEQLRTLEGRDDELDRLILHGSSRRPEDWEGPIRRLWKEAENSEDRGPLGEVSFQGE
jgi:hypothetical protein